MIAFDIYKYKLSKSETAVAKMFSVFFSASTRILFWDNIT